METPNRPKSRLRGAQLFGQQLVEDLQSALPLLGPSQGGDDLGIPWLPFKGPFKGSYEGASRRYKGICTGYYIRLDLEYSGFGCRPCTTQKMSKENGLGTPNKKAPRM